MFTFEMNINENYFYMPFGPVILEYKKLGLSRIPYSDMFWDKKRKVKWRNCKLYDIGWGRANGFERLPELQFNELIQLALVSDHRTTKLSVQEEESNKYGSIAIIMDRHIDELIDFLNENTGNKMLFDNPVYRNNLKLFCFDSSRAENNGGNGIMTYEEMLKGYPKWRMIEDRIKKNIYLE